MTPAALIFDVFGTMVDWRNSVARQVNTVASEKHLELDAADFADRWRAQYDPSMKPVRDGLRDYVVLDDLHYENLLVVLSDLGLSDRFSDEECRALSKAWERLDPWPDVSRGLPLLGKITLLAPCSNGSIGLMSRIARHAGFKWDCILGAEIARNYKPHPSVYLSACKALRLNPEEVMMVAAHNDDLTAAAALGLQTAFVPRPTEYGPTQVKDLAPQGNWNIVASDFPDLATKLNTFRALQS